MDDKSYEKFLEHMKQWEIDRMDRRTTNLYTETIAVLQRNGIDMSEGANPKIERVFAESFGWFWWDEFAKIAKNTWYDSGYGGLEIASDLIILGDDFWLERHEYDGSEWWEFKRLPDPSRMPHKKPLRLGALGYHQDLADAHDEEKWEEWRELPKTQQNQGI